MLRLSNLRIGKLRLSKLRFSKLRCNKELMIYFRNLAFKIKVYN